MLEILFPINLLEFFTGALLTSWSPLKCWMSSILPRTFSSYHVLHRVRMLSIILPRSFFFLPRAWVVSISSPRIPGLFLFASVCFVSLFFLWWNGQSCSLMDFPWICHRCASGLFAHFLGMVDTTVRLGGSIIC